MSEDVLEERREGFKELYHKLKDRKRQNVLITLMADGGVERQIAAEVPENNFSAWWHYFSDRYFMIDSEASYLDNLSDIQVSEFIGVLPQVGAMRFEEQILFENIDKDCFYKHILSYFGKQDTRKGRQITRKVERFKEEFDGGMPIKQVPRFCDETGIKIEIHTIETYYTNKDPYICFSPKGNPSKTFKFLNTRVNHVDLLDVLNQEITEVDKLTKEHTKNCLLWKQPTTEITKVITEDGIYVLSDRKDKIFQQFEKETGMNNIKIDSVKHPVLSEFIECGLLDSQGVDFQKVQRDEDLGMMLYEHIDQEKAYANFHLCEFYEGVPGKITDFRQTNKIEGIGYYQIIGLRFPEEHKKLFEKMGYENGVYSSVDLKFMSSVGCKYKIIAGCWGTTFHFRYPDYMLKKNNEGVRYYSLHAGCSVMNSPDEIFFINKEKVGAMGKIKIYEGEDCAYFKRKRTFNNNLKHVYGFVFAYVRIRTMMQLMKMEFDKIVRVRKDGIHYLPHNYERMVGWLEKPVNLNGDVRRYLMPLSYYGDITSKRRSFAQYEAHIGPGGYGKSYDLLTDEGLIEPLYVVVAHDLRQDKADEYGCMSLVLQSLLNRPHEFMRFNNLIIDEASMVNQKIKDEIIKKFPHTAIKFVGDFECQVGPIHGEMMNLKGLKIVKYKTNYRFTDELNEILLEMRKDMYEMQTGFFTKYFNIFGTGNITHYEKEDIILCHTQKKCSYFTAMFEHIPKYKVIENKAPYYNGQIHYKEVPVKSELRHGYTVHSVQGKTFKKNIYISKEISNRRVFYTAVSRAKDKSQIKFV